jgi:hypothetical protein
VTSVRALDTEILIFCRLENDEADDEELCWMEKSLKETTIELPTKAASISEIDNEPVLKMEPPTTPAAEEPTSHADSLSHLLPADTFAQISPRCYMFPGAEVTLENMEADSEDSDDDCEDSDEEDDDENEASSATVNEIVVPDIDNVLSNEVLVPEASPAPTTSSLSPTPSTSQLQCNDQEIVENITDIQANDASESLGPAPLKRPRLENTENIF